MWSRRQLANTNTRTLRFALSSNPLISTEKLGQQQFYTCRRDVRGDHPQGVIGEVINAVDVQLMINAALEIEPP